mgnify:CR=1 FL=1
MAFVVSVNDKGEGYESLKPLFGERKEETEKKDERCMCGNCSNCGCGEQRRQP